MTIAPAVQPSPRESLFLSVLLTLLVAALVVSGWQPYERSTWAMEVAPVFLVVPVLLATRTRFPLTTMLYGLIFTHALILMVGGAYTYARVPFGFWLQDVFGLARNPYDRIGHFAQGFVPALAAREILLRNRLVRPAAMASFLAVCVAMAVSACYELIEWGTAVWLGAAATDFLGNQGDPWDTQSDMFMALIGSTLAVVCFGRWHDRQIAARMGVRSGAPAQG